MLKGLTAARCVLSLMDGYRGAVPVIIVLGTLAALSEGVGISLIIPLFSALQGGGSSASNGYVAFLERALASLTPEDRFFWLPVLIFAAVLAKSCLSYLNNVLFSWTSSHVGHRLRGRLFEQLLSISYGFLERGESGKLLNTLTNESWRAGQAVDAFLTLLITASTTLVFLAILLLISWHATLMAAGAVVVIWAGVQLTTRRAAAVGTQVVQTNEVLAERMLDGLSAMRVIRTFGTEAYEQGRFNYASERVRRALLKVELLSAAVRPLSEVCYAGLFLGILIFALHRSASPPALLAFVIMLHRLQPHLRNLSGANVDLVTRSGSLEDVASLLDRGSKPYLPPGSIPFRGLRERITFERVTFRYDRSDTPALREVSFDIPRGKTTAIVGPSGAGKTTVINLIFRLYDVSAGGITVDGVPLTDLELASWRARIAFAGQDGQLLSGTVRENIAYGRQDATFEEIKAAAERANADDFVNALPENYETRVGDHGVRLSGGQRQRIALARAFLRNPEILVLDEATNELDSISEQRIQTALARLGGRCTVVLVAHRLPTIAHADHIVVLEDGRVIEQGGYEELLEQDGLFARLSRLQHPADVARRGVRSVS